MLKTPFTLSGFYDRVDDKPNRKLRTTLTAAALLAVSAYAPASAASAIQSPATTNWGRLREFVSGINGVASGGTAQVNLPCDRRYHRQIYQCTAINFTGGTGLTWTALTGSGTGLEVNVTVVNGVVTAITPTSGHAGSGFTTGDTGTFTDATGAGFVGTVTASGGAVTAIAITVGGVPTAISAAAFAGTVKQKVNGLNIADLTAGQEIARAQFNGVSVSTGQLPLFYTEPWRNVEAWPENTSWDMAGQNTFQIQISIASTLTSPGLTGIYEYDYIRNTVNGPVDQITYQAMVTAGNAPNPVLRIVSRHAFSFQLNAGLNLINTIPFNWPILRLQMIGSTRNEINQIEIYADGVKREEGFVGVQNNGSQLDQLDEMLKEYGFNTSIYDYAFVSDINQRIRTVLKVQTSLTLKVYSLIAQSLSIVQETLESQYA